jgi:hypothetical protein
MFLYHAVQSAPNPFSPPLLRNGVAFQHLLLAREGLIKLKARPYLTKKKGFPLDETSPPPSPSQTHSIPFSVVIHHL